ncbi:MAG TPA: HEAT repeat domain-containing protein [Chloroflexaceae bacterium]|nr:HEAT repeat domain-containing protein [Chloroflexaceae bacterium]
MTTERQEPIEQESAPANGSGGTTQVGQVVEGLERLTRRLPGAAARRSRPLRPGRGGPPREHLAALVEALGDTAHPLHAAAVDELVAIGAPAVSAICEALGPGKPWLTVYRAAEAAGRIGDGRAVGPLIQALNHPNSNVRWSAVRALTQIGDMRALLELRRVAQGDQGRTSWGEPVAGTAQSALAEIGRRSVWGQSLELVKTAVVAVLMILSLILAFSVVTTLRGELDRFGRIIPGQTDLPTFTLPTAAPRPTEQPRQPTAAAAPTADPAVASDPAAAPTTDGAVPGLAPTSAVAATGALTGTVRQDANVRPLPNTNNQPVGRVGPGDAIVFLAESPDGNWFLVRLDESGSPRGAINSADGTGWINQALVTPPEGELPVQDSAAPQAAATPTASP